MFVTNIENSKILSWINIFKGNAYELAQQYDIVLGLSLICMPRFLQKWFLEPPSPWMTMDILASKTQQLSSRLVQNSDCIKYTRQDLLGRYTSAIDQCLKQNRQNYAEIIAEHWWSSAKGQDI